MSWQNVNSFLSRRFFMADSTGVISSLSSLTQTSSSSTTKSKDSQSDVFLQLLTAELSNQNPLEPMDASSFVTQMVELESLNRFGEMTTQLESLQGSMNFMKAAGLVGKNITYSTDDGVQEGTVESVSQKDGKTYITVGGKEISFDQLLSVVGESK